MDVLHADGLIKHACPTGLKGSCHHLEVGADGRRGEEEGILAMDVAEVDGEAWKVLSGHRPFDRGRQFPDADRPIVVDAGCFGGLQFGIAAFFNPLSGDGFVVESYGANGTRWVAIFADLAARCIGTQQAAHRLFLEMDSFVHSICICDLSIVNVIRSYLGLTIPASEGVHPW